MAHHISTFALLEAAEAQHAPSAGADQGDFGEALLAAWPRPAAILQADGRLLAWNRDFALRMEPETLWRGRFAPPREHLVSRALDGGFHLVEWDPEEAAMGEARRLCQEEVSLRLRNLSARLEARDLDGMRAEAHGLRGLAANFGMTTLLPALESLEDACRDQDEVGAAGSMKLLREGVGPALQALAAQIG